MSDNLETTNSTSAELTAGSLGSEKNLADQVSSDLSRRLGQFNDPKKGLKIMARETQVHEKTLKRLIEKNNKPGYMTLYKIYRYLFGLNNDTQLLSVIPTVIAKELKRKNPKVLRPDIEFNVDVEKEIQNDPVYAEIYFLCLTVGASLAQISNRYGQYGINFIKRMQQQQVVKLNDEGFFGEGTRQTNLTGESIKKIGLHFTNRYLKPSKLDESGNGFTSFYAFDLNEEAYKEWLKIDEEAFYKKAEIAKQASSRGNIPAFTFTATDRQILLDEEE